MVGVCCVCTLRTDNLYLYIFNIHISIVFSLFSFVRGIAQFIHPPILPQFGSWIPKACFSRFKFEFSPVFALTFGDEAEE